MATKAALNIKLTGDVEVCTGLSQLKLNQFCERYNPPLAQEQLPQRGGSLKEHMFSEEVWWFMRWFLRKLSEMKFSGEKRGRDAEREKKRERLKEAVTFICCWSFIWCYFQATNNLKRGKMIQKREVGRVDWSSVLRESLCGTGIKEAIFASLIPNVWGFLESSLGKIFIAAKFTESYVISFWITQYILAASHFVA